MKDLLFFEKMITPKIINFVYWLVLAVIVLGGLGTMFAGDGIGGFFMGLLIIGLGSLYARIMFELLIVLFKMNEALQDIRNK